MYSITLCGNGKESYQSTCTREREIYACKRGEGVAASISCVRSEVGGTPVREYIGWKMMRLSMDEELLLKYQSKLDFSNTGVRVVLKNEDTNNGRPLMMAVKKELMAEWAEVKRIVLDNGFFVIALPQSQ